MKQLAALLMIGLIGLTGCDWAAWSLQEGTYLRQKATDAYHLRLDTRANLRDWCMQKFWARLDATYANDPEAAFKIARANMPELITLETIEELMEDGTIEFDEINKLYGCLDPMDDLPNASSPVIEEIS